MTLSTIYPLDEVLRLINTLYYYYYYYCYYYYYVAIGFIATRAPRGVADERHLQGARAPPIRCCLMLGYPRKQIPLTVMARRQIDLERRGATDATKCAIRTSCVVHIRYSPIAHFSVTALDMLPRL